MIKVILIDDEKMALEELKYSLHEFSEIQIIGEYTDPLKALQEIFTKKPDLVMLDIEMPEINGFAIAEEIIAQHPGIQIVFVTAYDEYAIKAFETNAIDYVLKPVSKDRLGITIDRACQICKKDKNEKVANSISALNRYFTESTYKVIVWENEEIILLRPDNILYFKSEDKDIVVVVDKNKYKTKYTLHYWEEKLLNRGFFRCHKGYLINLDKIEKITPMFNNTFIIKLFDHAMDIPVSRSAGKKLRIILGI